MDSSCLVVQSALAGNPCALAVNTNAFNYMIEISALAPAAR